MARQFAFNDSAPQSTRLADAFVIFSVTVLSLAFGAWFLLQLGMALWAGTIGALAVYTGLLSLHLVMRRSILVEVPVAPKERWVRNAFARAEADQPPVPEDEIPTIARVTPPATAAPGWAEVVANETRAMREELPMPAGPDPFHFRPSREPSLPPIAQAPPFLEKSAADPILKRPPPAPVAPPPAAVKEPASPDEAPEMSVEVIQDLIKRLADELNAAVPPEAGPALAKEAVAERAPAAPRAAPPLPPLASRPSPVAPGAPRPASAKPPGDAPPALNPQLARIAEAVAAERMEVLLEPIHALAEGRPRHFEVSVRLLTADGAALEQPEVSRATRGSGLMPRIDAARMIRAARVARRLGDRGRSGAVLALVEGQSLTDEGFIMAAAGEPGIHAGMGLVLSFAQSEVRAFTPGHQQALHTLAAGGFRFALEEVVDLDMDFAALKAVGFEFVKLDAPVFLEGLPTPGGRVPASDICRHLADFGLALIVGRIEDDWLLARILGFGVLFGKGTLFGEPRVVKDEVVAEPADASPRA